MEDYFMLNTDDKIKEYGRAIIKAVINTHTIAKRCQELTKEIDIAKNCGNKDSMVCVLQKYIQHYKAVLENRSMIRLCAINRQEYDATKTEDWIEQLNMMKSFVYGYEAQKSFAKEGIKACLKKILSNSGKFTKKEIDMLLH